MIKLTENEAGSICDILISLSTEMKLPEFNTLQTGINQVIFNSINENPDSGERARLKQLSFEFTKLMTLLTSQREGIENAGIVLFEKFMTCGIYKP